MRFLYTYLLIFCLSIKIEANILYKIIGIYEDSTCTKIISDILNVEYKKLDSLHVSGKSTCYYVKFELISEFIPRQFFIYNWHKFNIFEVYGQNTKYNSNAYRIDTDTMHLIKCNVLCISNPFKNKLFVLRVKTQNIDALNQFSITDKESLLYKLSKDYTRFGFYMGGFIIVLVFSIGAAFI